MSATDYISYRKELERIVESTNFGASLVMYMCGPDQVVDPYAIMGLLAQIRDIAQNALDKGTLS